MIRFASAVPWGRPPGAPPPLPAVEYPASPPPLGPAAAPVEPATPGVIVNVSPGLNVKLALSSPPGPGDAPLALPPPAPSAMMSADVTPAGITNVCGPV